jgi:hypothetical protein
MPATEIQKNTVSKKQALLAIVILCVIAIIAVTFLLLTLKDKDKLVAAHNQEILKLRDEVTNNQNKVRDEQAKLNAIAFAVHPENDYEVFRKKAYIKVFQETFPDATINIHDFVLVRVFNTTSFRKTDAVFGSIDNDDIVVYDAKLAKTTEKVPVVIIRPREQKVMVKEQILTSSLNAARSDNVSKNHIVGPTLNYFSEQ